MVYAMHYEAPMNFTMDMIRSSQNWFLHLILHLDAALGKYATQLRDKGNKETLYKKMMAAVLLAIRSAEKN
jgi:hypothetical protein